MCHEKLIMFLLYRSAGRWCQLAGTWLILQRRHRGMIFCGWHRCWVTYSKFSGSSKMPTLIVLLAQHCQDTTPSLARFLKTAWRLVASHGLDNHWYKCPSINNFSNIYIRIYNPSMAPGAHKNQFDGHILICTLLQRLGVSMWNVLKTSSLINYTY